MRIRLSLAAAVVTASFALPGAAQAQSVELDVPCVDAGVVTINCPDPQPPAEVAPPPSGASCPGRDLVPTRANTTRVRAATLCLLNEQRTKRGMRALKPVRALQSVASAYARRMVRERFFEHTAPDGSTFVSRIKRTTYLKGGLRRWSLGENIAWGTGTLATPHEIVRAWMASPGHKRNILDRRFTELGLGIANGAPQHGANGAAATYVNEFGERRR